MENKIVIAKAMNVKGSARKARIPADVVRGMYVEQALAVLEYMPKKAAADVLKVIQSAKANAVHNYNLDAEKLKVSKIYVGIGMKLKRMKPKSRGMASVINKHFCNITVELTEEGNELAEKPTETKAKKKAVKKEEVKVEKAVSASKETKVKKTSKATSKSTSKTVKSKK